MTLYFIIGPYFFLSSFSEDFTQNNAHDCRSRRVPKDLPGDLIMGPRESRLMYEITPSI